MSTLKHKQTDFILKKMEIADSAKKKLIQSKLVKEMSKKWDIEVKNATVKGIV